MKVTKLAKRNGLEFPEDTETETVAGIGAIHQHTRATRLEVETE